jgi:flagellar biosynthetic protein FliP
VIGHSWLQLLGALAITAGALLLALRLLRRLQQSGGWASRGVPLEVIKRVSVGPKQGVALLRVGERVLVVSIADNGTQLLTELADASRLEALAPSAPQPARAGTGRAGWLGALFCALALLVLPAGSRAQTAPRPAAAATTHAPAPSPAHTPALLRSSVSPATSPSPKAEPGQRASVPSLPGPTVTAPIPPKVEIQLGEGRDGLHLSGTVGLVVFLGALTLLPAMFLLMTSFTRILIVLHFLRSALGLQTTPPGQLLVALAILLTGVVMNPVLQRAQRDAIQPLMSGQISQTEAYQRGVIPFRAFMLNNTREKEIELFAELSGATKVKSAEELPTITLVSAFVTSELRTAFQMGFIIYLPFVVLDVIVASVLMSLGMFMLPPVMVSLPFKLLLFVLADGWTLVIQNLVASFR